MQDMQQNQRRKEMPMSLTREQVEEGDFDRAQIIGLIDTIAQQAQEIERLKLALTAMTTERDEAARQILSLRHEAWGLVEQRNAAQARVKELETKLNCLGKDFTANQLYQGRLERDNANLQARCKELEELGITQGFWGRACSRLLGKNKQLQATLAAREARVKELEAAHFMELKERLRYTGEYRDAKRKVEQLVTDLDTARQDAARLKEALQLYWTKEMPTKPGLYFYRRDSLVDTCRVAQFDIDENTFRHSKPCEWAGPIPLPIEQAQRALKGA